MNNFISTLHLVDITLHFTTHVLCLINIYLPLRELIVIIIANIYWALTNICVTYIDLCNLPSSMRRAVWFFVTEELRARGPRSVRRGPELLLVGAGIHCGIFHVVSTHRKLRAFISIILLPSKKELPVYTMYPEGYLKCLFKIRVYCLRHHSRVYFWMTPSSVHTRTKAVLKVWY